MLDIHSKPVTFDVHQQLRLCEQQQSTFGYFETHHEQQTVHFLMTQAALVVEAKNHELKLTALTPLGQHLIETLTKKRTDSITLPLPLAPHTPLQCEKERLQHNKTFEIITRLLALLPSSEKVPAQALSLLGVLGFDCIQYYENIKLPTQDPTQFPDFIFFFPEHYFFQDQSGAYSIEFRSGPIKKQKHCSPPLKATPSKASSVLSHTCDEDYEHAVTKLQHHIDKGDIFQAVLARRFSFALGSPLSTFLNLHQKNPSPYAFYIKTPNHTLFGFSPETALRIKAQGSQKQVTLSPLAGTRDCSDTTLTLEALKEELNSDPKERAEHMMLVDLARNDLARICLPGTREVTALAQAKTFGSVLHLRSKVEGILDPRFNAFQALLACSPMGTLSGAPKLKAIELIQVLEQERRGAYGGSVGLFQANGDLDTAIVIRSCVVRQGVAHVSSGAGVVKHSVPHKECLETKLKANSILSSLTQPQESSV